MPRKSNSAARKRTPAKPAKPVKRGAVRNTAIPKTRPTKAPAPSKATSLKAQTFKAPPSSATPQAEPQRYVTLEMIAQRAYEIWLSGTGGSDFDNWCRAERELRGE